MKKKKIPAVYTCTASHCLITAAIIMLHALLLNFRARIWLLRMRTLVSVYTLPKPFCGGIQLLFSESGKIISFSCKRSSLLHQQVSDGWCVMEAKPVFQAADPFANMDRLGSGGCQE